MTKNEFNNLTIGDKVVITTHGKNRGKIGIVREIEKSEFGQDLAYLEPFECAFEFCNDRKLHNTEGLFGWNSMGINYIKRPSVKEFHVAGISILNSVSWPVNNFTPKELNVIDRFLKELKEHTDKVLIDSVSILDREI